MISTGWGYFCQLTELAGQQSHVSLELWCLELKEMNVLKILSIIITIIIDYVLI